jgi:hypothetical protein
MGREQKVKNRSGLCYRCLALAYINMSTKIISSAQFCTPKGQDVALSNKKFLILARLKGSLSTLWGLEPYYSGPALRLS